MNESIKAGSDIHAGDGGYSVGTQEKYDEFVKFRNKSRIKDLKDQALCWAVETLDPDALNDNEWGVAIDKKFAELIVAEMLQICEDHPGWSGRMIGEQIKQHFGVEE